MRSVLLWPVLAAVSLSACQKTAPPVSASDLPASVTVDPNQDDAVLTVDRPASDNAAKNIAASTARKVPDAEMWRAVATDQDKQRVRGWYASWQSALSEARANGFGPQLDADPILFNPSAALADVSLALGEYKCRTTKLGSKGRSTLTFVQYSWFRCRVEQAGDSKLLMKISGSQRPSGRVFTDQYNRAIFLGTLALGDEQTALEYGSDRMRDMAGIVERIGEHRWRMALPAPSYESLLDVVELVPAD